MLATFLSLNLLLRATVLCGRMSFSGVLEHALGKRTTHWTQYATIVNNVGELVVFLIIIGDVRPVLAVKLRALTLSRRF